MEPPVTMWRPDQPPSPFPAFVGSILATGPFARVAAALATAPPGATPPNFIRPGSGPVAVEQGAGRDCGRAANDRRHQARGAARGDAGAWHVPILDPGREDRRLPTWHSGCHQDGACRRGYRSAMSVLPRTIGLRKSGTRKTAADARRPAKHYRNAISVEIAVQSRAAPVTPAAAVRQGGVISGVHNAITRRGH
jgi:hypothetical protein